MTKRLRTRDDEYVKIYLYGMGYDVEYLSAEDFVPCEICRNRINDVHHIDRRGMGGTEKIYCVEELMGICRDDHTYYGDKKKYREFLYWIHFIRMKEQHVEIDYSKLPQDLFFEQYSPEEKLSSVYYSLLINRDYDEAITAEIIGDVELLTITITNRNRRQIISISGEDKLELIERLIPLL